jgi:hypothetical protein
LVKATPTVAGTFPYTVTAKISGCTVGSANVSITVYDTSKAPTSATANPSFMCPGHSSTLTRNGGYLGYGATDWKWYSSSCGGTYVGSGTSITVTPVANTTYYVRAEGFCNTTNCASVPVALTCILASEDVNLKGAVIQGRSSLFWTVTSDSKILYLQLERSVDGLNYSVIKEIAVNGYADQKGYSFTDQIASLSTTKVYYKVRVVYTDGQIMESKVLDLSVNGNPFNAVIYPNPASSTSLAEFYVPSPSTVDIRLFSVSGVLLQRNAVMANEGYNSYRFNSLGTLARGVYLITISDKESCSYLKLIRQ